MVFMGLLMFTSIPVSAATIDLSGEWTCCGDFAIFGYTGVSLMFTKGTSNLAGTFHQLRPDGTYITFAEISGSLSGDAVKIEIATTNKSVGNTFTGKVIKNGNAMMGEWERQGASNSGRVTLKRISTSVSTEKEAVVNTTSDDPDTSAPVLRIIDVKNKSGLGMVKLEYFRDGKWQTATKNSTLRIGDKLRTGDGTVVAFEFLIGGRVAMNENVEVTIISDRGMRESVTAKRLIRSVGKEALNFAGQFTLNTLTGGLTWLATGPFNNDTIRQIKKPLEIQTNGGTLAIKG